MKRTIALILTLILTILLASCNNSKTNNPVSDNLNYTDTDTDTDKRDQIIVSDDEESDDIRVAKFFANTSLYGGGTMEKYTNDDWEYYVTISRKDSSLGYVELRKYIGESSNVIIPESLDGYPVVSIIYIAGAGNQQRKDIESIEFTNSLLFYANDDLIDTVWYEKQPDGPVYAGSIFYSYKGSAPDNTTITIKDGTKGIAGYAIGYHAPTLNSVVSIVMPDSLLFIANRGIGGMKYLQDIKLSNNLLGLNRDSLDIRNDYIKDIYIPKSLLSVSDSFNDSLTVHYAGTKEDFQKIKDYQAVDNQVIYEGE